MADNNNIDLSFYIFTVFYVCPEEETYYMIVFTTS